MMENQISNSSGPPSLGGLSEEILLKILDTLSNKDKFTMCQVSPRFNTLVHSGTRWKLDLEGDSSSKLARFSNDVKIIKSLKMSYWFDENFIKIVNALNQEDFYSFFKDHPEIKSLDLEDINCETLVYIGHFVTRLEKLRTRLIPKGYRGDFRVGFNNLEVLDLILQQVEGVDVDESIWLLLKHLSDLPKLRVLTLDGNALYSESIDGLEDFKNMKTLETLQMPSASNQIASKMIKACSRSLTSIFVNNIKDDDLYVLLESCPNLRTVYLYEGCYISRQGYAAFFRKLGRNLQHLSIDNSEGPVDGANFATFTEQDLEELINSKPTELKAVILDLNYKDHISSEGFIKFVRKHGKQLQYLDLTRSNGLDASLLSAVVENCPLVVQQGIWELQNWKISPTDVTKFLADCGSSVKVIALPKTCTDENLDELAANCPNLHALALYTCDQVTDAGLARFLAKCKGLRKLDISGTNLIKYTTFISETYPNLEISEGIWGEVWANCEFLSQFNIAGTWRME